MKFIRFKLFEYSSSLYIRKVFLINNSKTFRAYYSYNFDIKYHQFSLIKFNGEEVSADIITNEGYGFYVKGNCLFGRTVAGVEGIILESNQPLLHTITNPLLKEFIDYCYSNHIVE